MRGPVFRALAVALSISLAASGAAWGACMASQQAPTSAVTGHHDHDAANQIGHVDRGHGHVDHAVDQHGTVKPPVESDHGCTKCCGMCTVANAPLSYGADNTIIQVSEVAFAALGEFGKGRMIQVDPGIPKRIA